MTVIAFQPGVQLDGPWRTGELNAMVETLMPEATRPGGLGWDVELTEIGDPQFYLLAPPQDECLLCISRIGRRYVLEDGAGQVLFEHYRLSCWSNGPERLCRSGKRRSLPAPLSSGARCGRRLKNGSTLVVLDGEELLAHCVPQLAALA